MTTQSRNDRLYSFQPRTVNCSAPAVAIACALSLKEVKTQEPDIATGGMKTVNRYEKICDTRVASCGYRQDRVNDEPLCTYSRELVDTFLSRLNAPER